MRTAVSSRANFINFIVLLKGEANLKNDEYKDLESQKTFGDTQKWKRNKFLMREKYKI